MVVSGLWLEGLFLLIRSGICDMVELIEEYHRLIVKVSNIIVTHSFDPQPTKERREKRRHGERKKGR